MSAELDPVPAVTHPMRESSNTPKSSIANALRVRRANVWLWVAQALLAVTFASSGAVKVFAADWFMTLDAWPADVPRSLHVFVGTVELAGVLGLLLPRIVGIQPRLTVFAALGLLLIMVLATGFHAIRGEWEALPFNAAIGGVAAFVAWGRWRLAP
jgi:putative oxidoreductase